MSHEQDPTRTDGVPNQRIMKEFLRNAWQMSESHGVSAQLVEDVAEIPGVELEVNKETGRVRMDGHTVAKIAKE